MRTDSPSATDPAADEDTFQAARRHLVAELQRCVYAELLPAFLGNVSAARLGPYQGYSPDVDPSVSIEFSIAFRVGHSMVNSRLPRREADGSPWRGPSGPEAPLHEEFFRDASALADEGIEPVLRGLTLTPCMAADATISEELRSMLFRGLEGTNRRGLDLLALNVQRGRDHGLPGYNGVRLAFGLAPRDTFEEVTADPRLRAALEGLYESPDDVDAFVGGLVEANGDAVGVGELFDAVLREQFGRTRAGDRSWHELPERRAELVDGAFAGGSLEATSLAEVLRANCPSFGDALLDRLGGDALHVPA